MVAIFALVYIGLIIHLKNLALTSIGLAVLGGSVVSIIGVGYSFCSEVTFPIGEAVSCGFLQVMASLVSTGITLILNICIKKYGGIAAIYILGVSCTIGTIISFFVKEQLNKSKVRRELSSASFSIALVPKAEPEPSDSNKELA